MKKRGQVSFFLLIGMVLVIAAGLFIFISGANSDKKTETAARKSSDYSADIVLSYANDCLNRVSIEALFNVIGMQGGYMATEGVSVVSYQGSQVPYYLIGPNRIIPTIEQIELELSMHLQAAFLECMGRGDFESKGLAVILPSSASASAAVNQNDVTVTVSSNIEVHSGDKTTNFESFSARLPIPLNRLYNSSQLFTERAQAQSSPSSPYDVSSECNLYNTNGQTNVYVRNIGPQRHVIQFVDFSTYYENYFNFFIFQFAVDGIGVTGNCVS